MKTPIQRALEKFDPLSGNTSRWQGEACLLLAESMCDVRDALTQVFTCASKGPSRPTLHLASRSLEQERESIARDAMWNGLTHLTRCVVNPIGWIDHGRGRSLFGR